MGKRAKPEEIIAKLREVEVRMGRGETAAAAARAVGVTHSMSVLDPLGHADQQSHEMRLPVQTAGCRSARPSG